MSFANLLSDDESREMLRLALLSSINDALGEAHFGSGPSSSFASIAASLSPSYASSNHPALQGSLSNLLLAQSLCSSSVFSYASHPTLSPAPIISRSQEARLLERLVRQQQQAELQERHQHSSMNVTDPTFVNLLLRRQGQQNKPPSTIASASSLGSLLSASTVIPTTPLASRPVTACTRATPPYAQHTHPARSNNNNNVAQTLKALGSNLRQRSDPYIDCLSLDLTRFHTRTTMETATSSAPRGGVAEPFPRKVFRMLHDTEREGLTDIVSFLPHGRAFMVHKPDRFVEEIMPRYFAQTKWSSFTRQLHLWGFTRMQSGVDSGGFYHELFLKGHPDLCLYMRRVGIPAGNGVDRRKFKAKNNECRPDPDFYSMKPAR